MAAYKLYKARGVYRNAPNSTQEKKDKDQMIKEVQQILDECHQRIAAHEHLASKLYAYVIVREYHESQAGNKYKLEHFTLDPIDADFKPIGCIHLYKSPSENEPEIFDSIRSRAPTRWGDYYLEQIN